MSHEAIHAKKAELVERYEKDNGPIDLLPTEEERQAVHTKLTVRAKQLVKMDAHKAAVQELVKFAQAYASAEENPEVMAAVKTLTSKERGSRAPRAASPRGVIAESFVQIGDKMNEVDIFNRFKMGRSDMKGAIRIALQKAEPAERKWISFDSSSGEYTLVSIGADAPSGWTGYIPVVK